MVRPRRRLARFARLATIGGMLVSGVAEAPEGAIRGQARITSSPVAVDTPARAAADAEADGPISAISFVRARPGQRERLERFLRSNWLALDEAALQQQKITGYRMLRADADPTESSWDYAVVIDYASRAAMADFVPFYLSLVRERPRKRIDGLDFADLGVIVQQKTVTAVEARDVER